MMMMTIHNNNNHHHHHRKKISSFIEQESRIKRERERKKGENCLMPFRHVIIILFKQENEIVKNEKLLITKRTNIIIIIQDPGEEVRNLYISFAKYFKQKFILTLFLRLSLSQFWFPDSF